jgi:hypothetical protein
MGLMEKMIFMKYWWSYSQVPKDLNSLPGCRGYQAGQDGINHWVIDYNEEYEILTTIAALFVGAIFLSGCISSGPRSKRMLIILRTQQRRRSNPFLT